MIGKYSCLCIWLFCPWFLERSIFDCECIGFKSAPTVKISFTVSIPTISLTKVCQKWLPPCSGVALNLHLLYTAAQKFASKFQFAIIECSAINYFETDAWVYNWIGLAVWLFMRVRGHLRLIRELTQLRRRRHNLHIWPCYARAIFIFWHFVDVLVLSTTWNDLFCSCVIEVSIWWQMFNIILLPLKRWSQLNSRIFKTHFESIVSLNNWETIAETRSYIFRWRSRCRRCRVCVSDSLFCSGKDRLQASVVWEVKVPTNGLSDGPLLVRQKR